MANVFDFQLNADDNATRALAEIEARIKGLQPVLNSTREGLRFGGSETLENTGALSNKLRDMSRSAQDNVQNIGDMIPPLKNFGELFTKYSGLTSKMGLFGGIGGVVGGMAAGYKTLRDMGKEAYNLDT
ncbi:lytic transglycosylase domain-containing protein, partial [Xenorhabdus sp. XENO-10]|nr:lytic transglycosylase domain-containing protein [Xenorhabdus yunnanensis]